MNRPLSCYHRQHGVILIVALVFLLLLSLLAVSGMQTTTMEERMAGGLRDQTLALQAAEAALRSGEAWLDSRTKQPGAGSSCTTSCDAYVYNYDAVDIYAASLWNGTGVRSYAANTLSNLYSAPKFIVEYHSNLPDSAEADSFDERILYRITARGSGISSDTAVLLQSTYVTRLSAY